MYHSTFHLLSGDNCDNLEVTCDKHDLQHIDSGECLLILTQIVGFDVFLAHFIHHSSGEENIALQLLQSSSDLGSICGGFLYFTTFDWTKPAISTHAVT